MKRLLPFCRIVITLIGGLDTYLTIKYADHINQLELNPIGQVLLKIEAGNPALFMAVKFVCTVFVLWCLTKMPAWTPKWCSVITCGVTLSQLALLFVFWM